MAQRTLLRHVGKLIQALHAGADELERIHDAAESQDTVLGKAKSYAHEVMPQVEVLAAICSELEQAVDDALWPLPKFAELLFTR